MKILKCVVHDMEHRIGKNPEILQGDVLKEYCAVKTGATLIEINDTLKEILAEIKKANEKTP